MENKLSLNVRMLFVYLMLIFFVIRSKRNVDFQENAFGSRNEKMEGCGMGQGRTYRRTKEYTCLECGKKIVRNHFQDAPEECTCGSRAFWDTRGAKRI